MNYKSKELTKGQMDKMAKKLNKSIYIDAHFNLFRRIVTARTLDYKITKSTSHRRIVQAGRKNYVINSVTALEIFFRELIIQYKGWWPVDNFQKILSKEKITLLDALKFQNGTKLDAEHLVVFSSSFQNPDNINNIFSILMDKDFFEQIAKQEFDLGEDSTIVNVSLEKHIKDWKKKLYQLYEKRNLIVHEDWNPNISKKYVEEIEHLANSIGKASIAYLTQELTGSRINSKGLDVFR